LATGVHEGFPAYSCSSQGVPIAMTITN
jgi:hypothetical protein